MKINKYINKIYIKMKNIPKSICFDNLKLYIAEDVYNYDQCFFPGCSARIRNIIKYKNLTENNDYIWAYKTNNNTWIKTTAKYNKAKLLLTATWVESNLPKFKGFIDEKDYKYPIAPNILDLEECEKFKDTNNNIINIEIRNNNNEYYFRLKDVSIEFNMPSLYRNVIDKDTLYEENIHYKYFSIDKKKCNDLYYNDNLNNKKYSQYEIYLTYDGLLKIVFGSRNINLKKYINWNSKIIKNRYNSITDINNTYDNLKNNKKKINEYINNIKEEDSYIESLPGIYLFNIGNANKILNDNNYTDEYIICKYGKTNDIKNRTKEHIKTFKNEFEVDIKMLCFYIIDTINITNAENAIKYYFKTNNNLIKYKNYKELIIIKKTDIDDIITQYKIIQQNNIKEFKTIQEENILLKDENVDLKKQIEELKNTINELKK